MVQGTDDVLSAFLDAACFAGEVLADPQVGDAWEQPSALARMTVGDLAGHLFLVVRRVDKHLDESIDPSLPRVTDITGFPRVEGPDDLDDEFHRQVRLDGQHVARWGWGDVRDAYHARVETLDRRMHDHIPAEVALGGRAMPFPGYLASRVVELLVHGDDLLASITSEHDGPAGATVGVALSYLVETARRTHGDRAVLRAFTRHERTPPGAPSIF